MSAGRGGGGGGELGGGGLGKGKTIWKSSWRGDNAHRRVDG